MKSQVLLSLLMPIVSLGFKLPYFGEISLTGTGPIQPQMPINFPVNSEKLSALDIARKLYGNHKDSYREDIKQLWREVEEQVPSMRGKLLGSLNKKAKKVQENIAKKIKWDKFVTNKKVPGNRLRVKKTNPGVLGLDTVKQYSGYLDVEAEDKHFFYWFFESRNDPKTDPVILWLNGGPGCSSLTGLFFELGSSSISPKLKPIYNNYSWNSNASVIFLDQPVNVGYSYSSKSVSSTVAAGKDVYAFLTLFFSQFPEYNNLPFHIAGESYGGHYVPEFAAEIISHEDRIFDIKSILVGNGITDPLIQSKYYEPMACGAGGYPAVLTEEECQNLRDIYPRCAKLTEACYKAESAFTCVPANYYCGKLLDSYGKTGRNVYDIREMCDGSDLCYSALNDVDAYLNQEEVKLAVGAEVETYVGCSNSVGINFFFTGDGAKPFQKYVKQLLENDIPVLLYEGDKDFICNWLGNRAWSNALEWDGQFDYAIAPTEDWITNDGAFAGTVKSAHNLTFVRVFESGHMVPYNQPENSLDMLNKWIFGEELA